jgi:acetyl-CoA acyltransferase
MSNAVIAAYRRSPFTPAHKGGLARVRPDDLAGLVCGTLLRDVGLDPSTLEDVLLGCAFPEAEQGLNLARMVGFLAGLPDTVAGATVNRFCGSSMQAIHTAAGSIAIGAGEAFLCGGVESMTRVPMTGFNPMPNPRLAAERPQVYTSMGETAEILAREYGIGRAAQEAFALASHEKAARAQQAGALADELVAIESVTADECIRPDTSLEVLAGLSPSFATDGTVTAGTSSPAADGAAATLVCSREFAESNGLQPLATIVATAVSGCAPERMGIGPVDASRKALARAGIELADVDVIELNEAFAAQSLAVIQELGIDADRLNLDGGALALGHPLGASGARIAGKAAALLAREGGRYALATMCVGGGQGIATVLKAS